MKQILATVRRNDESVSKNFEKKHQKLMSAIIKILLTFYTCNYTNEFLVYLPNKAPSDFQSKYCMTPCPGKMIIIRLVLMWYIICFIILMY